VEQGLLQPQVLGVLVDEISADTTERSGDNVEKTEHSSPATRAGLEELGEVLQVVGTEDRVNSQLSTEGVEISKGKGKGLWRANNFEGLFETGLLNDLTLCSVKHVLLADLGLVVEGADLGDTSLFCLALRAGKAVSLVGDAARNLDNACINTVCLERLLHMLETLRPFAGRSVRAEDQHGDGSEDNDDEGDQEGYTPRNMGGKAARVNERVEDDWHDEVSDTTTRVTPSTRESVGSTDDILVEEASRPNLARNEGATEDTNKKSKDVETVRAVNGTSERRWDGTSQETSSEGEARTETIAKRTSDNTNDKSGSE